MIQLHVRDPENHPVKGILFYGPPGCSKTMFVRALVNETSFSFFPLKVCWCFYQFHINYAAEKCCTMCSMRLPNYVNTGLPLPLRCTYAWPPSSTQLTEQAQNKCLFFPQYMSYVPSELEQPVFLLKGSWLLFFFYKINLRVSHGLSQILLEIMVQVIVSKNCSIDIYTFFCCRLQ